MPRQAWFWILFIGLTISVISTAAFSNQSQFGAFISLYTLSFLFYLLLLPHLSNAKPSFIVSSGMFLRLSILFFFPFLSDDIYRFFWDAFVHSEGVSPYASLPSEWSQMNLPAPAAEALSAMNSPHYYSVYPPALQWLFSLCYFISPNSIYGFSLCLGGIAFLAEGGTLFLLYATRTTLSKDESRLALYAFNPLILIELMVNRHPEVFMIFGISFLFWGFSKTRSLGWLGWLWSSAIKIHPLLFSPLLLFHSPKKRHSLWVWIALLVGFVIFFLPLFRSSLYLDHFAQSLRLYYQTFEFNGSLYIVFRQIGSWWLGYNPIQVLGPILSIATFISIVVIALWYKQKQNYSIEGLSRFMSYSWLCFLSLAPIVHPWYISILIVLMVFHSMRFALVWSYLIMWTYLAYSQSPIEVPYWVSLIQYAAVFWMLYIDHRPTKYGRKKLLSI